MRNYILMLPEGIMNIGGTGSESVRAVFSFVIFLWRNQNPHERSVLFHLQRNHACIHHLLQSDRLLQWLWHHWAALPDKEQFPVLHTDSAHPPAICRILPFLIVIYASCPNLLSSFMDSENTWIILQKKRRNVSSFHLQGMQTPPQLIRCMINRRCF